LRGKGKKKFQGGKEDPGSRIEPKNHNSLKGAALNRENFRF